MPPRERVQTIETWDYWTISDLANDWSQYLQHLTGIPVTVTLQIVIETEDDVPYRNLRIHHILIPPAWRNRLGPWKELLTCDVDDPYSPAFLACWDDYLHSAPIRVLPEYPDPTSACIKILHHRVDQELVIDDSNDSSNMFYPLSDAPIAQTSD